MCMALLSDSAGQKTENDVIRACRPPIPKQPMNMYVDGAQPSASWLGHEASTNAGPAHFNAGLQACMGPLSMLPARLRVVRDLRSAQDGGRVPVRLLSARSTYVRAGSSVDHSEGRGPCTS